MPSLRGRKRPKEIGQKVSATLKAKGIKPSAEAIRKSNENRGRREFSPSWKGGRTIYPNGYALIYLPEHPRAHPNGYVYEHIVVMERKIGRPLLGGERVHHLDHDKLNNSSENLMLLESQADHMRLHKALSNLR
ncbi:MAG TPA: HNH endonuclease [Dehalococcoidia bacterium]|nr:HNH endonuclease [Dehalococcoidia bacterium]